MNLGIKLSVAVMSVIICCAVLVGKARKCAIAAPILNVRGLKAKNSRAYNLIPHISLWGIFVL